MNKVMLYCEMNDLTGFGHYNRMKILLKIMNLRNVDIITDNLKIAKVFFTNQNVLKVTDAQEYIKQNYKKYNLLIYVHFLLDLFIKTEESLSFKLYDFGTSA